MANPVAPADPPDFAAACRLLYTINIGATEFPADVPALDAWMASRKWPAETLAAYRAARSEAVDAYVADDGSDALGRRLVDLHRIVHMLRALPDAHHAAPFLKNGRKPGTVNPVRKAVRRILKSQPNANAKKVWSVLEAAPPKGMTLYDNRIGKYIETAGHPDTSYRRFANIVSEEKNPK